MARRPDPGCMRGSSRDSMLRINRQTDYAVRVLLALAKQAEGARLSTAAIQREMLVPAALMPRIVADLARTGLIRT